MAGVNDFKLVQPSLPDEGWYQGRSGPKYKVPAYVWEGQLVQIPWEGTTGLLCRVVVAAGNHARVVNEKRGIDRWFPIEHLRVPKGEEE